MTGMIVGPHQRTAVDAFRSNWIGSGSVPPRSVAVPSRAGAHPAGAERGICDGGRFTCVKDSFGYIYTGDRSAGLTKIKKLCLRKVYCCRYAIMGCFAPEVVTRTWGTSVGSEADGFASGRCDRAGGGDPHPVGCIARHDRAEGGEGE